MAFRGSFFIGGKAYHNHFGAVKLRGEAGGPGLLGESGQFLSQLFFL